MRRTAMLLVGALMLLAIGAGVVFAQEQSGSTQDQQTITPDDNQVVQCHGVPCYATGNHDMVYERVGNGKRDKILLRGGDDQVRADHYRRDRDVIRGSKGFDLIYVNDHDRRDKIWGGKGRDRCYVDHRSEVGSGCSVVRVVR